MKKCFNILFILIIVLLSTFKAEAMTFEEAFSQINRKPVAVLVYAQWADDYQKYIEQFRLVQRLYGQNYNFIELNIADKDAKKFCELYPIEPKLPYVFLARNNGKVSRVLPRSCASQASCLKDKFYTFLQ